MIYDNNINRDTLHVYICILYNPCDVAGLNTNSKIAAIFIDFEAKTCKKQQKQQNEKSHKMKIWGKQDENTTTTRLGILCYEM